MKNKLFDLDKMNQISQANQYFTPFNVIVAGSATGLLIEYMRDRKDHSCSVFSSLFFGAIGGACYYATVRFLERFV